MTIPTLRARLAQRFRTLSLLASYFVAFHHLDCGSFFVYRFRYSEGFVSCSGPGKGFNNNSLFSYPDSTFFFFFFSPRASREHHRVWNFLCGGPVLATGEAMNGEAQEADLSGTEVLILGHFLALRITGKAESGNLELIWESADSKGRGIC
ncbi:hypothetical protein B0T21DRAFT_140501 [Apiosordaria backusii]|uniref:Uncharacterized protein n=1 Tax=Apiosordaria backusii TaxID=314023 RepID=A0AA40BS30_9PEZI|nr:hypothetical protein B0T21DRAFT_140501 [Apiosordaria backusii]